MVGTDSSERQLEAHVGVHVAVRQVMNQLPHCPPAVPVGSIELRFAQSLHCGANFAGFPQSYGLLPAATRGVTLAGIAKSPMG